MRSTPWVEPALDAADAVVPMPLSNQRLQTRGFTVKAVEKYGHSPRYPISNNWPNVVPELIDFAQDAVTQTGEPVWLVGHSLGGYLSLMAAIRKPELVRGVVLIDSPIVGGWRSKALGAMKTTGMFGSFSPGALSSKRRNTWPSIDAAYTHFRHKKAFAKWDDAVLMDYVTHGTLEADGKRVLSFDRDVETQFYNTVPDNLDRLLSRHPVTKGRILMLDGSHLFPMEKPIATAAAIEAALRNLEG